MSDGSVLASAEGHTHEHTSVDASGADENNLIIDAGLCNGSPRRSGIDTLESGLRDNRRDDQVQSRLGFIGSLRRAIPWTSINHQSTVPKYSLKQAWFIVAGGLAVETKSFREETYLTITPAGAVELARFGLLSPIPQDVMDDKTKADPITKVLVCIQAGWFIVQCISRVSQGLPLSLLEIHVLAHVVIALLMYIFWFAKPYNAMSPLVLSGTEAIEAAALFSLYSSCEGKDWLQSKCVLRDDLEIGKSLNTCSECSVGGYEREPPLGTHIDPLHFSRSEVILGDLGGQNLRTQDANYQARLYADMSLYGEHSMSIQASASSDMQTDLPSRSSSAPRSTMDDRLNDQVSTPKLSCVNTDSRCPLTSTRLALRATNRLKARYIHFSYNAYSSGKRYHRATYLTHSVPDYSVSPGSTSFQNKHPKSNNMQRLVPAGPETVWWRLLFLFYSAFHLSAWNAHFPTPIERWMWRASGLTIVGSPVLILTGSMLLTPLVFAHAIIVKIRPATGYCESVRDIMEEGVLTLIFVVAFPMMILISVSRLYFLVEAVISLRQPGPRIYDTVQWTQYWPHL